MLCAQWRKFLTVQSTNNIPKNMCLWNTNAPASNKVKISYLQYQYHGHNVNDICVIWKGFISWVYMPSIKTPSLAVRKFWSRLKGLFLAKKKIDNTWTGQKLDTAEFHSRGIKMLYKWYYKCNVTICMQMHRKGVDFVILACPIAIIESCRYIPNIEVGLICCVVLL